MKITAAEFKEWHDTAWPEGYIWSDDSVLDDGRDIYAKDSSDLALPETFVVPSWWRLETEDALPDRTTVRNCIKAWRIGQTTKVLVVHVPREQAEALCEICKERGWRIL